MIKFYKKLNILALGGKSAIICSLARSYDASHVENKRPHLISSLFLLENQYFDQFNTYLNEFQDREKITYVFILLPNYIKFEGYKIKEAGALVVIFCNIATFLNNILFNDNAGSAFDGVFGRLNSEFKNFDTISRQSLFVFINQPWSNVVLNFKINNVDLSGGNISKRHVLQTVDYQLVSFLSNIFEPSELPSMIHKGLNSSILSSSFPLSLYEQFKKTDILNIKVKEIYPVSKLSSYLKSSMFDSLEENNPYIDIITSNFYLHINMLLKVIKLYIKDDLDSLIQTKNKYSSELKSLLYKRSNLEMIENVDTRYMHNKDKKRYKKERRLAISLGIPKQLSAFDSNISVLNKKIAALDEEIIRKEKEIKKFQEAILDYTISDLLTLYKKNLNNSNSNKFSYKLKKTRNLSNSLFVKVGRRTHEDESFF